MMSKLIQIPCELLYPKVIQTCRQLKLQKKPLCLRWLPLKCIKITTLLTTLTTASHKLCVNFVVHKRRNANKICKTFQINFPIEEEKFIELLVCRHVCAAMKFISGDEKRKKAACKVQKCFMKCFCNMFLLSHNIAVASRLMLFFSLRHTLVVH